MLIVSFHLTTDPHAPLIVLVYGVLAVDENLSSYGNTAYRVDKCRLPQHLREIWERSNGESPLSLSCRSHPPRRCTSSSSLGGSKPLRHHQYLSSKEKQGSSKRVLMLFARSAARRNPVLRDSDVHTCLLKMLEGLFVNHTSRYDHKRLTSRDREGKPFDF